MYLKNRIYHVSVRLSESHMKYLRNLGLSRYYQKSNISVVIRSCVERCMLHDKQSDINYLLPESGLPSDETQ